MYEVKDLGVKDGGIHYRSLVFPKDKFDGQPLGIGLLTLEGAKPGPTMFLIGAQHGVEINGTLAIERLLRELDRTKLRGRILAVPMANPVAFIHGKGRWPSEEPEWRIQAFWPESGPAYPKEMDTNMNRLWPGAPDGNLASRICHAIWQEAASKADFAVDCHCHYHWNSEVSILETKHRPSLDLGRALGCAVSHRSVSNPGMIMGALSQKGVPCACIELKPIYLVNQASVAEGVRMLTNALKHAKMLPGKPDMPKVRYEFGYEKETPVIGNATGLLALRVKATDVVRKGETLGEIFDVMTGEKAETIVAPCRCLVSRAAWNTYTVKGWAVCKVVDVKESRWKGKD
jgi:predicted deacylase